MKYGSGFSRDYIPFIPTAKGRKYKYFLRKPNRTANLILCFLSFSVTAFADIVSPEAKWPSQTIKFANLSTLGGFVLIMRYEEPTSLYVSPFSGRDALLHKNFTLKRDTAFIFQEYVSRRPRMMSVYGMLNKSRTDTIYVDPLQDAIEFIFTGVTNNKLQNSKKKKGNRRFPEDVEDPKQEGTANVIFEPWKTDKQLIAVSITGLLGLTLLFVLYKRKRRQVCNNAAT